MIKWSESISHLLTANYLVICDSSSPLPVGYIRSCMIQKIAIKLLWLMEVLARVCLLVIVFCCFYSLLLLIANYGSHYEKIVTHSIIAMTTVIHPAAI